MRTRRLVPPVAGLLLAVLPGPRAVAQQAPELVPVVGRAATPNAFQPALPCTLMLLAPGDRLRGHGLALSATTPAALTPSGDFAYSPFGADDFFFDQVNVFWHAQQFLERLRRYGLDLDQYPISVIVERSIGSGTHPTEPVSYIGTGLDGRNADAKDRDIIVHELTHAVFNPRMSTDAWPRDKGETQPVAEGLADYFAAVVNGDTRMGEYASPPDGYHDIASDPAVYNYARWDQVPGDPYSRGKILNGALLELRGAIGEIADELVFGALAHRPIRCMPCFADAVRWADVDRYGGGHLAAIDAAFSRRGIPGGSLAGASIDGPAYAWSGEPATFRIRTQCGFGPFDYAWLLSEDGGSTWQPLPGIADSITLRPRASFVLRGVVLDHGLGSVTVTTPPVAVYPSDDPTLRFRDVHIVGPSVMAPQEPTTYLFALDGGPGVPPFAVHWTVQGARFMSSRESDPRILLSGDPGAFRLTVRYADAAGQVATDTLTGTIDLGSRRITAIHIAGPDTLERDQAAAYSYALEGGPGIPPLRIRWTVEGGRFLGPYDDQDAVTISAPLVPVMLSVTYGDAAGQFVQDSRPVAILDRLSVAIDGPTAVARAQSARFSAAVTGGRPPYRLRWIQSSSAGDTTLPEGPSAFVPFCQDPFSIQLIATDRRGVELSASQVVAVPATVEAGGDGRDAPRAFRALGSVVPRGGPLALELPQGARGGEIAVLDPAGRVLLRRSIGAMDAARLTLVLPRTLEAGLYFARLAAPSGTRVTRFVVVPR